MNWDLILCITILVTGVIICAGSIFKEIKRSQNSIPDGKAFKREFFNILFDIHRAHVTLRVPYFTAMIAGQPCFKVSVKKDIVPEGLEYKTIPLFESYCVYIEDEAVCRMLIVRTTYKEKIFFEFSARRKNNEVIEIIKNVYPTAKADLNNYHEEYFNTKVQSFYAK